MVKKPQSVLIVTKSKPSGKPSVWELEAPLLSDFSFEVTVYEDLAAAINNGKLQVFNIHSGKTFDDFDLVDIHNYGSDQAMAAFMHACLNQKQAPIVNPELANFWHTNHKLFEYVKFIRAGLPVIDTLFFHRNANNAAAVSAIQRQGWEFPLVVKSATGIKGQSNYLVKTSVDFLKLDLSSCEHGFIVQPFIENDGDYRVLLIGDEEPLIFKRSKTADSHMNNTSQGATATVVPATDDRYRYLLELGDKARQAMSLVIAGADIMQNIKTGEYVLLEVNYNPAIVSGFMKEHKINLYIQYLHKKERKV